MRDEKLVRAIMDKEEYVMNLVIEKYSRLLWPIAAAVLKNVGAVQDVEECVADAFIYLWEHPERFDPNRGSLKSLLCIIVRSRAIDRYREITRKATVPLEEAVLTDGIGLQDFLQQADTRRELMHAVDTLTEPGREILIRRYYYNQKPREIAMALGISVKQVDNSLYRSKRQLRQALTER